ncbi:MAG: penicillin-binding protein [Akkermansia sp.]|nr:penicillin-binding protein [Akkermansia sp.]
MDELDDFQLRRRAQAQRRRHDPQRRGGRGEKTPRLRRFLVRLLITLLVIAAAGVLCGWLAFDFFTSPYKKWAEEFDLENINNLDRPCIIFDRNGEEMGRIFDENRSYVPLKDISDNLINAVIAQEDSRFREHKGYDPVGIARAALQLFKAGGHANQGASTITQQLARNAYDLERRAEARNEGKYGRKIVEIFLAMRIEEKYSKEQILEFYLNRICFGRGYYGIRAASLGYFGKEPKDLTVRESASLAALIKNPETFNPIRNPEGNVQWRNDVLDRMRRSGYLSYQETERLKALPLGINPRPLRRQTSHIHKLIEQQAINLFEDKVRGEEIVKSSGIRIYTTLDKKLQDATGAALKEQLEKIEKHEDYKHVLFADKNAPDSQKHKYLDGCVLVLDNSTGGILAYHGGRDFARDNYDIIRSGARPPGTAILPMLYMAAFQQGYNPTSRLVDDAIDNRLTGIGGSEGILGEWGIETVKGRYEDSVSARKALSQSKISASLRLGIALGSRPFIEVLKQLSISEPQRNPGSTEANPVYYPRIYVGTEPVSMLQMAMAYTALPNMGTRLKSTYFITRITDTHGNTLWEAPQVTARRGYTHTKALDSSIAWQIHSILQDSLKDGSAIRVQNHLPPGFKGAVKTGTNYDFADNWLFGYTSQVTCGVWIGFVNGRSAIYPNAFSSDTCAPVLGAALTMAEEVLPGRDIAMPDTVEAVEICALSGRRATMYCYESQTRDGKSTYVRNTYMEYLPKGDLTIPACNIHGEETPSLLDFMSASGPRVLSRILPIAPILPQSPALEGSDPYGCDLKLSPKYKDGSGAVQNISSTPLEATAAEVEEADEETSTEATLLPLPVPSYIRIPVRPPELNKQDNGYQRAE